MVRKYIVQAVALIGMTFALWLGNPDVVKADNSTGSSDGVVGVTVPSYAFEYRQLVEPKSNFEFSLANYVTFPFVDVHGNPVYLYPQNGYDLSFNVQISQTGNCATRYRLYAIINDKKYYLNDVGSTDIHVEGAYTAFFAFGIERDMSWYNSSDNASYATCNYYVNSLAYVIVGPSSGSNYVTEGERQIINQQTETNRIQEEGNELQEEANAIAEEQKQTSKGILGKLTEFFGGFFTNLENSVLHLIVPTAQEITDFLDEVNAWFSARLGFIWYPFDLAIRMVQALSGGTADTQFTVPALNLNILGETYTIWNQMTVNLDEFGIFVYVRFFTSALLASLTVKLAVDKWDEWIGGHDG